MLSSLTDGQTDRQTDKQTDTTEIIYHAASHWSRRIFGNSFKNTRLYLRCFDPKRTPESPSELSDNVFGNTQNIMVI